MCSVRLSEALFLTVVALCDALELCLTLCGDLYDALGLRAMLWLTVVRGSRHDARLSQRRSMFDAVERRVTL